MFLPYTVDVPMVRMPWANWSLIGITSIISIAIFFGAYFLLGAVGGIAWLILGKGQPMIGASGAIMGIVGIFFILYPNNDVTCWYGLGFGFWGEINLASWLLILFYFGCDLFGALYG